MRKYESILGTSEVYPNNDTYFNIEEGVTIVVPGSLFHNGKARRVRYYPYLQEAVKSAEQTAWLVKAGIHVEKFGSEVGEYNFHNTKKPWVERLKFHFSKPGRFVINGKTILAETGKEKGKGVKEVVDTMGAIAASQQVSFGSSRPRLIEIIDDDGKKINLDVRNMKMDTLVTYENGSIGVTKLKDAGGTGFRIDFTKIGNYLITGFEDSQGHAVFRMRLGEKGKDGDSKEKGWENPKTSIDAHTFSERVEEYLGVPKSDVLKVMKDNMGGINYAATVTRYGGVPLVNPAKQLLGIIGKDKTKWGRAKNINAKLNITLSDFSGKKMDSVLSILYLSNARYAVDIIEAMDQGDMSLGLSFEGDRRTIDLEQDRSTILIVSEKLEKDRSFKSLEKNKKTEKIKQHWEKLQGLREQSIKESEELENGKQKTIDLCIIDEKSLAGNSANVKNILPSLNSHPDQKGSEPKISTITVDTLKMKNLQAVITAHTKIQEESEKRGHHLVTFIVLHGNTNGISFPFSGGSQSIDVNQITNNIDEEKCSLFVSSCYGGEHARLQARGNKIEGAAFNVGNTINSLIPSEFEDNMIKRAYAKKSGKFVGDLNGDDKVTLAELRIWIDRDALHNDPSSYDKKGNQLTDLQDLDEAEGLA